MDMRARVGWLRLLLVACSLVAWLGLWPGRAVGTVPGSPGFPQAPATVYAEDFQNVPGPNPILGLNQYTGASGETYTADPPWLSTATAGSRRRASR
jgi:hypothetical protein